MAPSTLREWGDMSLALNPRFGLQKPTAVLRVFNITVGVMFSHLPTIVMTQVIGVEGDTQWDLRCSTYRRRAALGHKKGLPYALCQIFPPLTMFLWVVNVSVTKLAAWSLLAVAVTSKILRLQLKAVSLRQNWGLSDLDPVY